MVEEGDAAAPRHLKTEEAMQEAAVVVVEDWIDQVWELVLDIGASLILRKRRSDVMLGSDVNWARQI
jgi:hypothetical protein